MQIHQGPTSRSRVKKFQRSLFPYLEGLLSEVNGKSQNQVGEGNNLHGFCQIGVSKLLIEGFKPPALKGIDNSSRGFA